MLIHRKKFEYKREIIILDINQLPNNYKTIFLFISSYLYIKKRYVYV